MHTITLCVLCPLVCIVVCLGEDANPLNTQWLNDEIDELDKAVESHLKHYKEMLAKVKKVKFRKLSGQQTGQNSTPDRRLDELEAISVTELEKELEQQTETFKRFRTTLIALKPVKSENTDSSSHKPTATKENRPTLASHSPTAATRPNDYVDDSKIRIS